MLFRSALHEWFKLRLGIVEHIRLRSGEIETVAGSTAFDNLSHAEFTGYMQKVKALVRDQLIPRINSDALEREARAMLGDEFTEAARDGGSGHRPPRAA